MNMETCNSLVVCRPNPMKPMLLITPTSNCFSPQHMDNREEGNADDIPNEQVGSTSSFAGADIKQPIPYMPRKNPSCKKVPVKETASIKISKVFLLKVLFFLFHKSSSDNLVAVGFFFLLFRVT